MEFKRGDTIIHTLKIPREIYREGNMVYFMAKESWDNDLRDAKAEISKEFGDDSVELTDDFALYKLRFLPEDTIKIEFSNDSEVKELLGEFEIRTLGGEVYSFPSGKDFIKVKIYADIRRGGR